MSRPDLVLVTIAGEQYYGVVGDHPDQKESPGRKVVHLIGYQADPSYVLIEEDTPLRRPAVVDPHDSYDTELLLKVLPAAWKLLDPEEIAASRQELYDSLLLYIEHQRDAEPGVYAVVLGRCIHMEKGSAYWVRDALQGWWATMTRDLACGDQVHSWKELIDPQVQREGVESDG